MRLSSYSPKSLRFEKDCPKCRYGTLRKWFDKATGAMIGWRCMDCQHLIKEPDPVKPSPVVIES